MANNAVNMQLPSMVIKPKKVWPGLDKMGLHHKSIAGDGNCLFASLSDQLYGSPDRHLEIRATIVEHMRELRPIYEGFVQADDIITRRTTRSAGRNKPSSDDSFEVYLTSMSQPRTYGGQPELLAFVRAYNQEVHVHLPPAMMYKENPLCYTSEDNSTQKHPLHICYGGDEDSQAAHYDSSRPNNDNAEKSGLPRRPKATVKSSNPSPSPQPRDTPSSRDIRSSKSDMMHELVTQRTPDHRSSLSLTHDGQRPRSSSVSSSHYSTGSKRSREDEASQFRARKRANQKAALRNRAGHALTAAAYGSHPDASMSQNMSSGPPTPTSSQDTDSNSDRAEYHQDSVLDKDGSMSTSPDVVDLTGDSDDIQPVPHSAHATMTLDRKRLSSVHSNVNDSSSTMASIAGARLQSA